MSSSPFSIPLSGLWFDIDPLSRRRFELSIGPSSTASGLDMAAPARQNRGQTLAIPVDQGVRTCGS